MQKVIDPRRQAWLPYIRQIADLYGLKDWLFDVDNDSPTDKNANASVFIPLGRRYCWIRLAQEFLDETPEEQRLCIVHELTHCHINMLYGMSKDFMGEDKRGILTTLMELGVDSISVAIAKFFPLPINQKRDAHPDLGETSNFPLKPAIIPCKSKLRKK